MVSSFIMSARIQSLLTSEQIAVEVDKLLDILIEGEFPLECMDKVFANPKLRPTSTRDFFKYVIEYATEWHPEMITEMELDDIKKFEDYFFFKQRMFEPMKKQILVFCNTYPEFRGFNLEGVLQNMKDKLVEENKNARFPYEYINTCPKYGGFLKPKPKFPEPQVFFMTQIDENDE